MDIELPTPEYRQDHTWSCGPAALKILLDFFGHPVSEDQLIHLTDAKSRGGTEHEGMVQAAEILGHQVYAKEDATEVDLMRFLSKGVPVVVDFQGNNGGHFAVVSGLKDNRVQIDDPRQTGSQRHSLDMNVFMSRWFNIRYDNHRRINRWMMALLPS
jgi:ABC-type bacteriocin/lantibiotic exporter with double-glycine peptidase domain